MTSITTTRNCARLGALFALASIGCAHVETGGNSTLCGRAFQRVPGDACLALPPSPNAETPVILFLHGMYPAHQPQVELAKEDELARAAVASGFALLSPRGRRGLCDWSPEFREWYCWPTAARQKPIAGQLLIELGPAFVETARRLGNRPIQPFVMGFSNGGFFAALLADEGRFPVRGFAILHGGPVPPTKFQAARAVPTLLIAAQGDAAQLPKMQALHDGLEAAGWKPGLKIRAGSHGLTDEDIASSLRFFQRVLASKAAAKE